MKLFCDSIVFKKILKVSFRLKANWDFHSNFPKNIVTEGKIKSFDKVFWSNIAERKCTVFLYWSFQFETLKILFGFFFSALLRALSFFVCNECNFETMPISFVFQERVVRLLCYAGEMVVSKNLICFLRNTYALSVITSSQLLSRLWKAQRRCSKESLQELWCFSLPLWSLFLASKNPIKES